MTNAARIAYTHPTPRHVRGPRHATEVHALAHRMGDLVQSACGINYTLHEAPHTRDGVRLTTEQTVTCSVCRLPETQEPIVPGPGEGFEAPLEHEDCPQGCGPQELIGGGHNAGFAGEGVDWIDLACGHQIFEHGDPSCAR